MNKWFSTLSLILLVTALGACESTAIAPTATSSVPATTVIMPAPLSRPTAEAEAGFQIRQFDPAVPFFGTISYPDELISMSETELIPMRCSPEYFSWSGTDHEYVDPTTQQRSKMTDPLLLAYLASAQKLNPGQTIPSVSVCEIENEKPIVVYRVGPCGGGCIGLPHVSYGQTDGSLELVTIISPDGDGAYFGCRVSQLTTGGILYVTCLGEGTGIIRKIDLLAHSISTLLSCSVSGLSDSEAKCKSN